MAAFNSRVSFGIQTSLLRLVCTREKFVGPKMERHKLSTKGRESRRRAGLLLELENEWKASRETDGSRMEGITSRNKQETDGSRMEGIITRHTQKQARNRRQSTQRLGARIAVPRIVSLKVH